MVYGYCRTSTPQQSIERQKRNILAAYPRAKLFCEQGTGTTLERPKLAALLRVLRPGDTVIFDSVSRMSRNAADGFALYQQLFAQGIELIFLKEPHINTATYKTALAQNLPATGTNADYIIEGINRYLMALAKEQIRLAFAQSQKEVDDLRQRTREGIETARLAGKQIGGVAGRKLTVKKAAQAKPKILQHSRTFGGTLTDAQLIKLLGLARGTYYKYKKELREE